MHKFSLYPPPSRPVAMGSNGMVSSAHPLASMAGIRMLSEGGNAFDAAVATAATLNVVEPYMSGVGGIGVALAHVASEGRIRALNFSGRAPKAAEPDRFTNLSDYGAHESPILTSLVPGNLAGWLTLHETYGSVERERLFETAIKYAEEGFPITFFNSSMINGAAEILLKFPNSASIFLKDGKAGPPGTRLKLPDLAKSLRLIAKDGLETFYRGEIASRIVKGNQNLGGLLTEEDLAEYHAEWQEPISVDYRDHQVFTTPPNCSSFQVLQTLKLMETFDSPELSFQHPDTTHNFMEAVKLCITDRIEYAGDPDYIRAPLNGLLTQDYASHQKRRIDPTRAALVSGEHYALPRPEGALKPGSPAEFDGGMTTHFAVADRDGNVVSVTQTLGGSFGCGAAMGSTGIFLNNMASYFELDETSPNRIGPGKRVDFVVAPTQTMKNGKFFLSMGTPGSYGILQTTPQFLMNVLEFGLNIQQAIDAPRFRYTTERNVDMEEHFPIQLRTEMTRRGHMVKVIDKWSMAVGGAQGILVDHKQGTFQGGADPRRDGYALGW